MVDGEIVPSHQKIALGTSGRLGAIPKDAPLLFTKRPRAVFPQKERFEQTAQDVNALLALTNLIRSLQNGKQILAIEFFTWFGCLDLFLPEANLINSGRKRNQQVPGQAIPFAMVKDHSLAFKFLNQNREVSVSVFATDVVGLKTLTTAVQQLEELTGEEVDIEEGAIASRFRTHSNAVSLLQPPRANRGARRSRVKNLKEVKETHHRRSDR